MGLKYLVSYASPEFDPYRNRLNASALVFGIDRVISYRPSDILGTEFYRNNKKILDQPKGAGYWIWKPYVILDAMLTKAEEGAVIVYSDADSEFYNDLHPLFTICEAQGGTLLFKTMSFLNRSWTKRDCFILMGCDTPEYWDAEQIWAGFSIFINNERSRSLIKEWLHYCMNEHIITDSNNCCGLDNFPDFIDHRFDQSVLSLLAVKNRINVFKDLQLQFLRPDRKWNS
ncbi:hypothetical protein [Paenibacillus sp. Soil787]|uniref:hypothetical protein n=1 Tax=Paenibacillus sp. Soil787 TaxID=1736411 RepID=UPI000702BE3C|nr:hypothetical protein [Paenibacillus sp. Soil787]KRF18679.1 hypothetical protein ASG93_11660 [Paenibacillus sp. Soil787]